MHAVLKLSETLRSRGDQGVTRDDREMLEGAADLLGNNATRWWVFVRRPEGSAQTLLNLLDLQHSVSITRVDNLNMSSKHTALASYVFQTSFQTDTGMMCLYLFVGILYTTSL
jgi:hypothetical protein